MKRLAAGLSIPLLLLCSSTAFGQLGTVTTAVLFEGYRFDEGLPFKTVSQLAVPVTAELRFGGVGKLTVSGGWVNVWLTSRDPSTSPDQTMSGPLDTEARLSVNLIPGRLMLLANGSVPTGTGALEDDELSVVGVIASDVIGFSINDLGSGGNVGGGFVGAFPVGSFAFGLAATYRYAFKYAPRTSQQGQLRPGPEFRVRSGFEGPLGRRTYLRMAGIYSRREQDEFAGQTQNGVGDRFVGYLSFNQAVGSSSLVIYGFDVFRTKPQVEPTAVGAAILPRGNLLAAGLRWAFRVGPRESLTPRVEFRNSWLAESATANALQTAGRTVRGGLDFRRQMGQKFALVLQGDGLLGFVVQEGNRFDVRGFRVALHGEFVP